MLQQIRVSGCSTVDISIAIDMAFRLPINSCVTIGECPATPELEDVLKFVSTKSAELDMVIQFDLADLGRGGRWILLHQPYTLGQWKTITQQAQRLAEPQNDAWAVTYLENHDQARSITRYASDAPEHRVAASKMLATYLLTVSGTIIIYQGRELKSSAHHNRRSPY